jgi:hypothetical protein
MNASETILDIDSAASLGDSESGFSISKALRRWARVPGAQPVEDGSFVVKADEHGLSLTTDGESRAMSWAEMQSIRIEVNDRQPFGVNLWWAVEGPTKRMFFPKDSRGASEVKQAFTAFVAGFDADAVARAEQARSEARITCWERVSRTS